MYTRHCKILTALVAGLAAASAFAAATYIGADGGVWADNGNWNSAIYPGGAGATDNDTRINGDGTFERTVNLSTALVTNLTNLQLNDSLSPPNARLNVNAGADLNATVIQVFGNGLLNQSGGTVNTPDVRLFGNAILRPGNYLISGGTLSTNNLRIAGTALNSSIGTLGVSGGTVNVATELSVAGGTNSIGAMNFSDGTVNILAGGTLKVRGVGTGQALYDQSGGLFNNAIGQTITLQGVNGVQGEFRLSGGVFNAFGGSLDNSGLISSQGFFTMTGGFLNMGGGALKVARSNSNDALHGQIVLIDGGTIMGVSDMWGGVRLNNAGAVFIVGADPDNPSSTLLQNFHRGELQVNDGTVVFPVFANGSANLLTRITGYQQGPLDLTGGTIAVEFASAYTPLVGDSFDLVDGNLSGELSAANVSSASYDGDWTVTWDTSQWESDGMLTIQAISPVVPGCVACGDLAEDVLLVICSLPVPTSMAEFAAAIEAQLLIAAGGTPICEGLAACVATLLQ